MITFKDLRNHRLCALPFIHNLKSNNDNPTVSPVEKVSANLCWCNLQYTENAPIIISYYLTKNMNI